MTDATGDRKEGPPPNRTLSIFRGLMHKLREPDMARKSSIWGISIAIGIALVIGGYFQYRKSSRKSFADEQKLLGPAYVYFSNNRLDSAQLFLSSFVSKSYSPITLAKANLLLGRVNFALGKYDDAIVAYEKVPTYKTSLPLLESGASYGRASSLIEKGDYTVATQELEGFIKTYGRRGSSVENSEPDLSPAVPGAYWKLALCYWRLGDTQKARNFCDKLIELYSEESEAANAARLLNML